MAAVTDTRLKILDEVEFEQSRVIANAGPDPVEVSTDKRFEYGYGVRIPSGQSSGVVVHKGEALYARCATGKTATVNAGGAPPDPSAPADAPTDILTFGNSEIQTLHFNVSGSPSGTFTLTFDGHTTAPIGVNDGAAEMQAALRALPNIEPEDLSAALVDGSVHVYFSGQYAFVDVPLLVADQSAMVGWSLDEVAVLLEASPGDVELLNGWRSPTVADDGEPALTIYKQGGRVWLHGDLVAPGGNQVPFNLPESHRPEVFGRSWDIALPVTLDWDSVGVMEVAGGNPDGGGYNVSPPVVISSGAPAPGTFVGFDGISWPAAS